MVHHFGTPPIPPFIPPQIPSMERLTNKSTLGCISLGPRPKPTPARIALQAIHAPDEVWGRD